MCLFNKEKKILLEKIGQLETALAKEESKLKCPSLMVGKRIGESFGSHYEETPYVLCTEKGRVGELEEKVSELKEHNKVLQVKNSELHNEIEERKNHKNRLRAGESNIGN